MNILFISIISKRLAGQRAEAKAEHANLRDEIAAATSPAQPTDPGWSVAESTDVYLAAVKVAVIIGEANGEGRNYTGCHDCSMRILGAARAYAAESGLDHRKIVAGLSDVATVIEQNTSPFDGHFAHDDWWQRDARLAGILLPVICRVYEAQLADEHMRSMLASPRKERGVMTAKEAAESFLKKWNDKLEGKGPVAIYEDRICVECRPEDPGPMWIVELAEIQNPTRLLKWVSDLTSKTWCTAEMVRDFVAMVCHSKGWELYDFAPGTSQEA